MIKWVKTGKRVSLEGTTITYSAENAEYPLDIESRKRHIPHANGVGTWDHTSYFVMFFGKDVIEKQSLRDAKEYAEAFLKTGIRGREMQKTRCIIKRPDEKFGHVTNISTSLENLQKTVGGHIETFNIAASTVCICNEEGKILGLEPNFLFGTMLKDMICGTVIIIGVDGEGLTDIPISFDLWKNLLQKWGN